MELCCLNSLKLSSIPRSGLQREKPFLHGRTIKFPPSFTKKKSAGARKLKPLNTRAQASVGSETSGVKASKDSDKKDRNLIYVAGATGKVGLRTVRELLKLGFKVRAGVRNKQRAESLLKPTENLEIVECDLEKSDRIVPALSNASVVICCIGASEKEISDITGPYRIDYLATKNLIEAATFAKVDHFILLTSLGTNKVGFPAAILNLFWGVLIWKRKAEEALLASGLPYTIVRPGGMERPTDSYKETHNVTLSEEDTLFGGQVSNLQVAELLAFMAKNRGVSYCKVVEVIAETTAPLTPFGDLLAKFPSQRAEESTDADEPEPEPEPEPKPAGKEINITESPSPSTAKENSVWPQSPYTAYEDLKPPVSPTPNPPIILKDAVSTSAATDSEASANTKPEPADASEPKPSTIESQITQPSSPFAAYEDLKPPSSPSPTPSHAKDITKTDSISPVDNDPAPSSDSRLSPYIVYEDLKPPSSPSPSAPVIAGNGKPVDESKVSQKEKESTVKQQPLSPFTMYEDLKPPSSPTPSL